MKKPRDLSIRGLFYIWKRLLTTKSPHHFREGTHSLVELFDFDPFVNGVCLLDIAGAEHDEFHGFAKDHAVGAVGYGFGIALVCDGEGFLHDARFYRGVEWGEAIVYVDVYPAFFGQCSDYAE